MTGIDAGEWDGNTENGDEIVAGTFLDPGTFDDWLEWHDLGTKPERNRGQLLLLKANQSNNRLQHTILNGDGDLTLGPREGIRSGVFGVKVDDVNGDGDNEIWCGDAAGHLYLFELQGATWELVYRSKRLGGYPGYYNNIFPLKADPVNQSGATTGLVVVSPGYVYWFDVDSNF